MPPPPHHGAVSEHQLCFKLGKPATETYKMLENVYGNEGVFHMLVLNWLNIREGHDELEHDARSGQASTARYPDTQKCVNW